mgnify:CR=1 FL=1
MIVAVKRNKKQKFFKIASLFLVIAMFIGYYYYMSAEFEEKQKIELEQKKAMEIEKEKQATMQKNFERTLLSEIEKAVDLIGQAHVKHVKIIENKLVIICEPDTNLEALMVRYGTMALTKKTLNEIIIAIDINYVVESKLNAS